MANPKVQHQTITQPNTIIGEEVDKITDEFTLLWLSPAPSGLQMPQSLHMPKK